MKQDNFDDVVSRATIAGISTFASAAAWIVLVFNGDSAPIPSLRSTIAEFFNRKEVLIVGSAAFALTVGISLTTSKQQLIRLCGGIVLATPILLWILVGVGLLR